MIAVVDASVVLKWFLQEPDAEQAIALRDRHFAGETWSAAPDLLLYEVGNALRFKHDFTPADIQAALSDVLLAQLELFGPTERLLHRAVELVARTKLTYYDCLYLAVASDLGAPLITADQRLHAAAGKLVTVRLLHETAAS